MTRLDVPGGWADIYDPLKVPERRRRPVVKALVKFMASQNGTLPVTNGDTPRIDPSVVEVADDLNDALIVAMVQSWSFGDVTVEVLLDLPADAYRALSTACSEHVTALMPNFQVSPDPKAAIGS